MRLKFSILWFDDNKEYLESVDLLPLEAEIKSWGFYPLIEPVTTSEEFISLSPYKEYDLIVVDRNLGDTKDGQDFIADIRSSKIYTEIIFYTAMNTSDLWKAIFDKQLEGIYVSNRDDIISKIIKVGEQSIRKILDLENMRGIVMAEVGELDLMLEEIITLGCEDLSREQQQHIYEKFHKKASEQYEEEGQKLGGFIKFPDTVKMLKLCDSDKRWQSLSRLCKAHEKLKKRQINGDYVVDVLAPRNFLAHGRPESDGDGGYIFHYNGKTFSFTETTSTILRQTIIRYKKEFSEVIKLLTTN